MDPRCPRQLEYLPCEFCPLAVLRLKALRNSDKELTEEEEAKAPGCQWAIAHQLSNYCFFNYVADYLHEPPSDKEIAHMNNVSVDTVKDVVDSAMNKIRDMKVIRDLEEE